MKICTKCFMNLPLTSYGKTCRKTGRLHASCKNCRKLVLRKYYIDNKEKISVRSKKYQKENKKDRSAWEKNYQKQNRLKSAESWRKYYRNSKLNEKFTERRKTDVQFRLSNALRSRLRSAIKHNIKSGSAVSDLGCSVEFLKEHLESQFTFGMTWDSWGHGKGKWHVDHIMPLAAFNLEDRQHFLLACHYGNLQPLWSEDNFRKSDRIPDMENYLTSR